MIGTRRIKRLSAGGIAIGFLILLTILMVVLGTVFLRSGSGADPARAFSEVPNVPESFEDLVTWNPDPPLPRSVEPNTRALVEASLVRGWKKLDTAQRSGVADGIDTLFLNSLAERAAVGAVSGPQGSITQHGHDLTVTFYSVDGSIMTLDATSDLERSVVGGPSVRYAESFEVVLFLSDGNWRMQHLTRRAVGPAAQDS